MDVVHFRSSYFLKSCLSSTYLKHLWCPSSSLLQHSRAESKAQPALKLQKVPQATLFAHRNIRCNIWNIFSSQKVRYWGQSFGIPVVLCVWSRYWHKQEHLPVMVHHRKSGSCLSVSHMQGIHLFTCNAAARYRFCRNAQNSLLRLVTSSKLANLFF